jgi:hypothetical protein
MSEIACFPQMFERLDYLVKSSLKAVEFLLGF